MKAAFCALFVVQLFATVQQSSSDDCSVSPSNVHLTAIYSTSCVVSWNNKSCADSYRVQAKIDNYGDCSYDVSAAKYPPFTLHQYTQYQSSKENLKSRSTYFVGVCTNQGGDTSYPPTIAKVTTGPNAPTEVTTNSQSSTVMEIQWKDDDSATIDPVYGYNVSYRLETERKELTIQTPTSPNEPSKRQKFVQISNLQPNTKYLITKVVSLTTYEGGIKTSDPSSEKEGTTLLGRVRNLTVNRSTQSELDIIWEEPEKGGNVHTVKEYVIDLDCEHPCSISTKSNKKTSTISGLSSNTRFNISVAPVSSEDEQGDLSFIAATTTPKQAVAPEIINRTASSVFLKWEYIEEGTSSITKNYTVRWLAVDETESKCTIKNNWANITSLNSNTKYSFTITAINEGGSGLPSNASTTATLLKVKAGNSSTSTVSLSWPEPVDGGDSTDEESYEVICSPADCNTTVSGNTAIVYNLTSSSNYLITVVVRMLSDVYEAASDPLTVTTVPESPILTSNDDTELTTTNSTVVFWNRPDGGEVINNYSVQYRVGDHDEAQRKFTESGVVNHTAGITKYNHTISKLQPGQIYDVKVVAQNSEGSHASLTTRRTVPAAVKFLNASQDFHNPTNVISLEWKRPEGVGSSIEIKYYILNEDTTSNTTTTSDFDVEKCSLEVQSGFNYTITATAISGNLESETQQTTINSKPALPASITTKPSANMITVSWGAVEGNAESIVINLNDDFGTNYSAIKAWKSGSVVFSNLKSNTTHSVEVYSIMLNILGNVEKSKRFSESIRTNAIVSSSTLGLIVGLTVAGVFLIGVIAGALFYFHFRRRIKKPAYVYSASSL